MKNKGTILKIFSTALIILCAVVILDLMMSVGDAHEIMTQYDSVKTTRTADSSMKTIFLKEYTRTTGDITLATTMGVNKDTANSWASGNSGDSGGGTNPTGNTDVTGTITSSDITAIAKSICASYTSGLPANAECYVAGSGTYAGTPYGTVTYNSKVLAPYSSSNVYNRCCNGLSSGILFLCGVETYNNGSRINGSWPYISCDDIWNKIGTQMQPTTFGELKVGDIICIYKNGNSNDVCHVETVVKIAGDDVYIASAGSSNGIWSCASQGYCRVKPASSALSDFYNSSTSSGWGGVKGVVRP